MSKAAADAWRRALEATASIGRDPFATLPTVIRDQANRHGADPALLSHNAVLSYHALGNRMDHYARWAIARQLGQGDVVCLLMANDPDYPAIWLGIAGTGCIVALLNTNLRGVALASAIAIVAPSHVIVGASLADAYHSIASERRVGPQWWAHGGDVGGLARIDAEDAVADVTPDIAAANKPRVGDTALYLYTSGTTGLPKAVPVSHYRLLQWSQWFRGMIGVTSADRMYNCLPMYHSAGGIVATCAILAGGGSVVVAEGFSGRRFWADIAAWDCTLFQYIGELCRYLLDAPAETVRPHAVRLACGNGLRGDIWERFQRRFHIPRILEFYAATEGNVSLYNCEQRPGSIGRVPRFLEHRFPLALVRFDVAAEQPIRGDDGFCVRCCSDEVGEALGRIPADPAQLVGRFEGYTDPAASEAKILRDVFAAGDAWYRTGDLMRRDRQGYYYFVDRIGDTFRWKGENVSTTEVAAVIAACPGVTGVVVYGVAVPHHDGRACMAAMTVDPRFAPAAFHATLVEQLPAYARPMFLRLCPTIEATATFKLPKGQLALEGYDPSVVADPLYVNDRARRRYVRLDVARHAAIGRGGIRL